MKVDPCYEKKYGWAAFLLLFLVSNIIWIAISSQDNKFNLTLEEEFQLGTLLITTTALIGSIIFNIITIREVKIAQRNRIKPKIAGNYIFLAPTVIILRVSNFGPGIAQDVVTNLELIPRDNSITPLKYEFRRGVMNLSENDEFGLETYDKDTYIQKYEGVKIQAFCTDIEGFHHEFKQILPSDILTPKQGGITHLWENPRHDEALVQEITKSIDGVSKNIEQFTKTIQSLDKMESDKAQKID